MNMNETISQYTNSIQNSAQQSDFNFSLLFSVIIFVAVAVFVGVYIRNFMKGFNLENISPDKEQEEPKQYSIKQNLNQTSVYCNTCGQENDIDSKFCKNCGSRLR